MTDAKDQERRDKLRRMELASWKQWWMPIELDRPTPVHDSYKESVKYLRDGKL